MIYLTSLISQNYKIQLILFLLAGIIFKSFYLLNSSFWITDIFCYIEGAKSIIDGQTIYKNFGDIKPPGIFWIYFLLIKIASYDKIFISLKFLVICFQTLSALCLSRIGDNLFKKRVGLYLGLSFLFFLSLEFRFWSPNIMLLSLLPLLTAIFFLTKNKLNPSNLDIFLTGIFFSLGTIISTNLILMTFLIPITISYRTKNIKKIIKESFIGFCGFVIIFIATFFYFYKQESLPDFLWWNFQWPLIYSYKPIPLKIINFFYGLFKTWELLPLYIIASFSIYKIIKTKEFKTDKVALFLISFLGISILTRLTLSKPQPRYYLYLIPALLLPCAYFHNLKLLNKKNYQLLWSLIIIAALGFNWHLSKKHSSDGWVASREKIYEWIKNHTAKNDFIFVWPLGKEFYYKTKRRMATSFFSPKHHLAYVYAWEHNNYKNLHLPWEKFTAELKRDNPKLIIDLTGNFSYPEENLARPKLVNLVDNFRKKIYHNYNNSISFGKIKIWQKK